MIRNFNFILVLILSSVLGSGVISCTGATGTGGGAGPIDSNISAVGLPNTNNNAQVTSGSIQAGGEGQGQQGRKVKFVIRTEIKGSNNEHSNCGLPENLKPFPEGEESPTLTTSFAPANRNDPTKPGPFVAPKTHSMGAAGRLPFDPPCPLLIGSQNTGVVILPPFSPRFAKLIVTFLDKQTNIFYQTETDPSKDPNIQFLCNAACDNPPCEICLTLKPESEIAEADRISNQETPDQNPPGTTVGTVPSPGSLEPVDVSNGLEENFQNLEGRLDQFDPTQLIDAIRSLSSRGN